MDTFKVEHFARTLRKVIDRDIDESLPIHEKILILAIRARKLARNKLDERTLFASVCTAFGTWIEETHGEDAVNYVTLAIPKDFNPRSVYNIELYDEKVTKWLRIWGEQFGPIWPENKWWMAVWDNPLVTLDELEELIWKEYIYQHSS